MTTLHLAKLPPRGDHCPDRWGLRDQHSPDTRITCECGLLSQSCSLVVREEEEEEGEEMTPVANSTPDIERTMSCIFFINSHAIVVSL
ncbi:hypothetical protein PoB_005739000 [Plakobranchus ocellatus]|uniref:Uncharacterized protein n=1 Tax=Plakobranchus ocellatus TaxID=259542 RepID=A0AAV4CH58_9GAST|nr:hypothetical protein PoB_005739000 [Plakobranchus ocellatus]